MISTLLVWIYIFLLTTLAGHFVFRVHRQLRRKDASAEPSTAELSMTGLTFLGIFLSIFSLFLKIGLAANLILFTLCLIYFLAAKDSIFEGFKSMINAFKQLPSIFKILITGSVAIRFGSIWGLAASRNILRMLEHLDNWTIIILVG